MKRLLEDFVQTPIANTYSLVMLIGAGVEAWHSDLHGALLFVVLANQAQIQRRLP